MPSDSGQYKRIQDVVRRIPEGRVATYGQIAGMAGLERMARRVGYALSALPEGSGVPWHRVVNAKGGISPRGEPHYEKVQRAMLEQEGVVFEDGFIPLERFRWRPRGARPSARGGRRGPTAPRGKTARR